MLIDEYLLTCLIEELSEVQKEVCKCLRFTTEDTFQGESNVERVRKEFSEVMAIIELLQDEGIHIFPITDIAEDKKRRLEHWMAYSRKLGALK